MPKTTKHTQAQIDAALGITPDERAKLDTLNHVAALRHKYGRCTCGLCHLPRIRGEYPCHAKAELARAEAAAPA